MNPTLPTTIHRSVLGILGMIVVWFLVNVAIIYGVSAATGYADMDLLIGLAVFIIAITSIVLLVSIYLYYAATLTLTSDGLQVLRYKTLFWSIQSTITYEDIQEVSVTQGGILKGLFNVGTLLVQTSSAEPILALNFLPDVDQLRDYIAARADAADSN